MFCTFSRKETLKKHSDEKMVRNPYIWRHIIDTSTKRPFIKRPITKCPTSLNVSWHQSGTFRAVGPLVSGTFSDGTFSDGRLLMGRLVMGHLVMGHLVMGHLVTGPFVCAPYHYVPS